MPHSEGPVPQVQAKEGPMPQLVKKRRLGWAVLAVGALIASLFAVGASPAAAIDDKSKQDNKATSTACLGAAAESQGFSDVMDGDEFAHAIDCLAYYGISKGTGDGSTFSPNDTVSRWQMAVFLARAARLMGVDIGAEYDMDMMDDMDMDDGMGDMDMMDDMHMSAAGFSDLGSVASWIGHEIDNIVKAGVMSGHNSHFDPDDAMSRVDMAVALVTLVDKASSAVSTDNSGRFMLGTAPNPVTSANDYFDDVRMGYPAHVDNAVSVAYELGITGGVGDGTSFDPSGSVTRGQMAAFITRAMDHTGLRPAGVTAQSDGSNIVVSVRDANLAPVANAVVDGFYTDNASMSRAFKDDGTCNNVMKLEGDKVCEIDSQDRATGANGDVTLSGPAMIGESGVTAWVWTGTSGAMFNSTDTSAFEMELTDEPEPESGTTLSVTSDLAADALLAFDPPSRVPLARYGSTVNLNIQLIDNSGTATGIGAENWELSVAVKLHAGPTTSDSVFSQETLKLSLDASGAASVALSANDPNPQSAAADTSAVSFSITGTKGVNQGISESDVEIAANLHEDDASDDDDGDGAPDDDGEVADGYVQFSDEAPAVTAVAVDAGQYHSNPGPNAGASNTATISVFDQYGASMSGVLVRLSSNEPGVRDGKSNVPGTSRVTGRDGTVRISYSHTGSDVGHDEMLTAKHGMGVCEDRGGIRPCGRATVYWVTDAMMDNDGTLLTVDTDRNAVIVDDIVDDMDIELPGVVPVRAIYDSNDQFLLANAGDTSGSPVSIDAFEKAMTDDIAAKTKGSVKWSSYMADDRSDVAIFTYTKGG